MYSNSHFKYFKESKDYKSFYKQQKKFINTLSKIERDVLISFTKGYDHTYNGLNEDDIKLTNNTIGAEKGREILHGILKKAPAIEFDLLLFRGFLKNQVRKFPSYTLDPKTAEGFVTGFDIGIKKRKKKGILQHVDVRKGTRMLLLEPITLYPGEEEILLHPDISFLEKGKKVGNKKRIIPININYDIKSGILF